MKKYDFEVYECPFGRICSGFGPAEKRRIKKFTDPSGEVTYKCGVQYSTGCIVPIFLDYLVNAINKKGKN